MKWLKHMTATWDDERVARLVDRGGMEGLGMYGLYWRVQEIIASQMEGAEPHCSVRYTVTRWSLLLSLRGSLVFSTLSRLAATGLVTATRDGDEILVTNRNLLKYRDEYSKKSRQSQDNIPPRTEGEGEGEQIKKEKEIKNSSSKNTSTEKQEEFIYQAYCRKVGKKLALKAIQKSIEVIIKGDQSHPPIPDAYEARRYLCKKVLEYSSSPTAQPPPKGEDDFRPHPATWFNEGRYWDDPAEWRKQRNGTHNNRKNTGRNVENNQTHIADLIGEIQEGNFTEARGDNFFSGGGGEPGIFPSDGRKTIEGKL